MTERLFTFYFAILHDLMVFQVQIQDCRFSFSAVQILSSRVSLLKLIVLQANEMSFFYVLKQLEMTGELSDSVSLCFYHLSFSLSHLSHLSLPLLFETCESDEVEDKKRPCFTVSGWMKKERERERQRRLLAFLWFRIRRLNFLFNL